MTTLMIVYFAAFGIGMGAGCFLFHQLSKPPSESNTFPDAW
jgi:hypothetical protein